MQAGHSPFTGGVRQRLASQSSVHSNCFRRCTQPSYPSHRPAGQQHVNSFWLPGRQLQRRLLARSGSQQPWEVRIDPNGSQQPAERDASSGQGGSAPASPPNGVYSFNGGAAALSLPQQSPLPSVPDAASAPAKPQRPHRWNVVYMIAVAFVLCNMDKVCR